MPHVSSRCIKVCCRGCRVLLLAAAVLAAQGFTTLCACQDICFMRCCRAELPLELFLRGMLKDGWRVAHRFGSTCCLHLADQSLWLVLRLPCCWCC